jgi:hypothetical protein
MTAAAFVATCRCCGRQREPQAVSPENGWSLLAVACDLAAEGWRHDPVKGFRLCPACGDAAGIPYSVGAELMPGAQECLPLEVAR